MSQLPALLASLTRLQIPENSPDHPPPLTEFTLFGDLPVELRVKIWAIAACEPRKIILKSRARTSTALQLRSSVDGQTRHPSLLQVNFESRQAGLQFYEKYIEIEQGSTNDSFPIRQGCFPVRLCLVFATSTKGLQFCSCILNRIERLEVIDSRLETIQHPLFNDRFTRDKINLVTWRKFLAIEWTNTFKLRKTSHTRLEGGSGLTARRTWNESWNEDYRGFTPR
ncbi:hypothetical protein L207DRAFT_608757 [Hyaloscypha variabilis F]|uniref:2EXR domain-containing protein n=1 Tax=Hyaloscypha variabilis (strain UAMH 11265 / GT02V1 / F) TaxID=1149755 RepID=A0A2J6R388_HYAVF|nr:hypothetical protein L207DRAFT_608757 [Hyaloscypha variabilis F]